MELIQKIRALQIEKRRSFRSILLAELLLLLVGIIGLFGKKAVYDYPTEAVAVNTGSYQEDMEIDHISLTPGIYRIQLHYDTDTEMKNFCNAEDDTTGYRMLRSSGEHLYQGLHQTDFQIWLLQKTNDLRITVTYGGEGSYTVTGLTIEKTNGLSVIFLLCILFFSVLADLIYLYVQYDREYKISVTQKGIHFGLVLIVLVTSLPLLQDTMISSGDLGYHMLRMMGIKDGILSGQFPVRIAPEWQQGYGYASSIFYGETLLYVGALFRLIGFSYVTSYRLFMLFINILTVGIAYYSFRRIFQERYIGLLCTMLYTLSVYRLSKTFICGSLGETFGILFLPLIAYGFYRVFTQEITDKEYRFSWIPLTVAFTGLVQSHLLTGEQVGAFTILLCLLLIKKVFRKETFCSLAKTVIYSVLLSAWFLISFGDYMLRGDFMIQHVSGRPIQYRGLYPAHLLFTFFRNGSNVFYSENGMGDSQPMGLGITLVVALLLWGGMLFFRRTTHLRKEEKTLGKIAGGFALLALWMSLSVFPWDKIQSLNGITATLVSSIQFPNRFLTIATVCLVLVAGVVAKEIKGQYENGGLKIYFAAMAVCTLCSSIYLMDDMLQTTSTYQIYGEEGMGSGYIAGAEYLPYGADASQFWQHDPYAGEAVEITDYYKNGLETEMYCRNLSGGAETVELPLLYYYGYRAYDKTTGQELMITTSDNYAVCVELPGGYEGTVHVAFYSPWYWRAAEAVSYLSLLALSVGVILEKKRERKNA